MDTRKLEVDTILLLAGHIASCLSVFLISAGSLMRMLRTSGELPSTPVSFGDNPQPPPRRTSYFDH